ncbi:MAG: 6-bladed beta-propeller [Balneolaceae bacterium]
MKNLIIALTSMFLLAGCSMQESVELPEHIQELENLTIYSADAEPAYQLHLEREQAFGDTDENLIGNPGPLAVDHYGRVYIGDNQQKTVHIFQPDGSYLTNIGREGEGPGEFQWIGNMNILSNQLFIYDPNGRRVNVYRLAAEPDQDPYSDPEFSQTINLSRETWDEVPEQDFLNIGLHSVRSDHSLLLSSQNSPLLYRDDPDYNGINRYYLTDPEGKDEPEMIFEQEIPKPIVTEWFVLPPPFLGRELMAQSVDDRIFSTQTDDLLIKIHGPDGIYRRAFYYPFTKVALTREDAINSMDEHEQLQNAVRNMDLPETWPVINQLFTDDRNQVWAATIVDDPEIYDWWIMKEDGELLARLPWPRNQDIRLVRNDFLYTRETDEETGLQHIVRYSMDLVEM